jgi:ankyrin repeat protein
MTKWIELLEHNDYVGVKKYLKEGGDVDEENENGESVLLQAIRKKCDDDIIDLLLENGADLNDFDNEGVSVFDFAVMYNNGRIVDMLLEQGADVNRTQRRSRFTLLMGAVCYGRTDIAKKLLAAGADKEAEDDHGLKARDYARKMQKKAMMELLEES